MLKFTDYKSFKS